MRKPSFERERESLRERAREIHLVNLLRGVPVKLHMAQSSNSRQQGRGGRQRERNGYRERWRKKNMQWDSKSDCSLFDKVIESQLKLCHVSLFKGPFTQMCSCLQKQRDMSQQLKTSIYDLIMQKNSTYGCKNVNFSRSPALSLYWETLASSFTPSLNGRLTW